MMSLSSGAGSHALRDANRRQDSPCWICGSAISVKYC